ncbi:hydroxyacid dehydrogenase [Sporomusa termitida]|uniref:(S)-sulfolactate dehydrogenase n=1 Tax=Sporomusa termitida TaxID=2377 RepID=A0A517DX96_9FIRM|nr:hydroxyacid dehydrogenase [Sporomusa termitida]QDR81866.1 (S)-sulfolactate dehydrogenase [Sporomusa termitida]
MDIIITEAMGAPGLEVLRKSGYSVQYDPSLWSDVERLKAAVAKAKALIVRNQTKVNKELLYDLKNIKIIGRLGVGLDNIDLGTTAAHGIPVVTAKNANAVSVAEYVLAAILTISRPLLAASADVKAGGWNRKCFGGTEIQGKTLGLIGIGEIGHRTGIKAKALGLNVIGCDPRLTSYDIAPDLTGITLVSEEEVLRQSDFVSLHVPLLPSTSNLIDRAALARMKSTAYVINTSRGGVVNEEELYEALTHNQIAGAVLDVLHTEPPGAEHPLFSLPNCLMTPHVAGAAQEALNRTSLLIAAAVLLELGGDVSKYRVDVNSWL